MVQQIDDKIIDQIVDKLVAEYAPQQIILFGSYASDNAGPDSDIDLLIIKDTQARFIDRWVEVRRILSDPHREIPIETLVLNPQELHERLSIGDQFISEIVEKGRILYAA